MKTFFKISAWAGIVSGLVMFVGGFWGVYFTYQNISREKITTPTDASIPGVSLRGPLTLQSQVNIIRAHTLKTTNGKTFAEMPRQIPKVDATGKAVLDADGKPVMIPNTARDIWITATTLMSALNLAILAYAFFGLLLFLGLAFGWSGVVLLILAKNTK